MSHLNKIEADKIKTAVKELEIAQAVIDKIWKETIKPLAFECSTIDELRELMNEVCIIHDGTSSPFHMKR